MLGCLCCKMAGEEMVKGEGGGSMNLKFIYRELRRHRWDRICVERKSYEFVIH